MRRWPLIILLSISTSAVARAQASPTCPTDVPYPGASWPDATAQTAQEKPDEIAALEKYMFTLVGPDSAREGIRTDGLLIIQNGQLIYERYARSFTATNKHLAWSVTKSLTHALVGIATQHGVSTGDSICKYLPNLRASNCGITLMNLMEMSSGLYWDELYENESNQASSVLAMLYGPGHADMDAFVASQDRRFAPGSTWYYSTGDGTLLGGILDAAMKPILGDTWEWTSFFNLIGITDTTLERDRAGHSIGGSYWWATPRDMARLGYLYLNNGCWNGMQVLPAGWTQNATQLASSMAAGHAYQWTAGSGVYGRLWWLNIPAPSIGQTTPTWPGVPTDAYAAEGHWGQYIIVIPSKNMVIVRTGDDRDPNALDENTFIPDAIAVGH